MHSLYLVFKDKKASKLWNFVLQLYKAPFKGFTDLIL